MRLPPGPICIQKVFHIFTKTGRHAGQWTQAAVGRRGLLNGGWVIQNGFPALIFKDCKRLDPRLCSSDCPAGRACFLETVQPSRLMARPCPCQGTFLSWSQGESSLESTSELWGELCDGNFPDQGGCVFHVTLGVTQSSETFEILR